MYIQILINVRTNKEKGLGISESSKTPNSLDCNLKNSAIGGY